MWKSSRILSSVLSRVSFFVHQTFMITLFGWSGLWEKLLINQFIHGLYLVCFIMQIENFFMNFWFLWIFHQKTNNNFLIILLFSPSNAHKYRLIFDFPQWSEDLLFDSVNQKYKCATLKYDLRSSIPRRVRLKTEFGGTEEKMLPDFN